MPRAPQAPTDVRIVDYADRHHSAFRALNLAWISEHFEVEDSDRAVLDDPRAGILEQGGIILMAEDEERPLGCVALLQEPDGVYELAKLAVDPAARGRGIGILLTRAAIDRARALGARRVELLSNSALANALALYRKVGFVQVPVGDTVYQRADVRMVLDL